MTPSQIKLLADLRSGAVRLVPVEATLDMQSAALCYVPRQSITRSVYRAMLSVTPDLSASLSEMIEALDHECQASMATIAEERARADRAEAEVERLRGAISWALGEGDSDFGDNKPENAKPFWWRAELRARALSQETTDV